MFHVGQKVVCVDDQNWTSPSLTFERPILGRVYVVRGFTPTGTVKLEEIKGLVRNWRYFYGEGGWLASRFRPVISRSTESGMSILRGILNGQRVPENV